MYVSRFLIVFSMLASGMFLFTSCGYSTIETINLETGKKLSSVSTGSATYSTSESNESADAPNEEKVGQGEAAANDAGQWGTIKGRIIVAGKIPEPVAIVPGGAAGFCGVAAPMMPGKIVVGKDQGLKNTFLFLYQSRNEKQEPKVHPSYEETAKDKIVVDNVNCMFEPHVLFLRTSQKLVAKNSDPKGHNIQNTSRVNPFNPLIAPGGQEEIEMEGPERLPTQITCNIHPWMKAYMIVRDEPYVAISDKDGNFEIKNMPAGDWKFQFWHETCGYMIGLQKDGKPVMEGRPSLVTFNVRNGETIDLGDLTIAAENLRDD